MPRSLLLLAVGVLLAVPPLRAQTLAAAQVGIAPVAATTGAPRTLALHVEASPAGGHARWPFVLGGAVVGAAATGLVVANQIRHTDDAMVFPQYVVVVVGAGAGVGALLGWAVSAALP